jgi:outer membrane translocation and assembly module TamA
MRSLAFASVFPLLLASALQGQSRNHAHQTWPTLQVTIRQVVFENAQLLSPREKAKIGKMIREEYAEVKPYKGTTLTDLADEAAERARQAYQNKGYFKVKITAAVRPVGNYSATRSSDIVVTVLSSGRQYRLQGIHFAGMKVFPEEQLLSLIPIRPGEIFNRAKVAKGLEALQHLYDSAGYVNFTSVPETRFDEANATIAINIDIDEGRQFRWGDLIITGRNDEHTQAILDGWGAMRGKVYSPESLQDFFSKFFHPVPANTDPSRYTKRRLNECSGTVDVSIEFVEPLFDAPQ